MPPLTDASELPWSAIIAGLGTAFASGAALIRYLAMGRIDDLKLQIEQTRGDVIELRKQCEELHDEHLECEKRNAELTARIGQLERAC